MRNACRLSLFSSGNSAVRPAKSPTTASASNAPGAGAIRSKRRLQLLAGRQQPRVALFDAGDKLLCRGLALAAETCLRACRSGADNCGRCPGSHSPVGGRVAQSVELCKVDVRLAHRAQRARAACPPACSSVWPRAPPEPSARDAPPASTPVAAWSRRVATRRPCTRLRLGFRPQAAKQPRAMPQTGPPLRLGGASSRPIKSRKKAGIHRAVTLRILFCTRSRLCRHSHPHANGRPRPARWNATHFLLLSCS